MVLSVTLNLAYMKSVIYVLFSAMFQTVVELMLVVALKEINKTLEVNFSCLDNKDAGAGGGGGVAKKTATAMEKSLLHKFRLCFQALSR